MIATILKRGLPLLPLVACMGAPGISQPYPSNVIRIVVPTGPGTPPDIISRIIANELSESDGWKVIVENRGGALQTIATADVLKQAPDGYTVLAMSVPMMAAPTLLPHLGLRPETDFAPVIKLSASYNVLVVTPTLPAKSVSELVDLLKSQPDKYNFSSAGFGTPAHLIGELFKLKTGVPAIHVPYQQGQQRLTDLMNGTNSIRLHCHGFGGRFHCNRQASGSCGHRTKARRRACGCSHRSRTGFPRPGR